MKPAANRNCHFFVNIILYLCSPKNKTELEMQHVPQSILRSLLNIRCELSHLRFHGHSLVFFSVYPRSIVRTLVATPVDTLYGFLIFSFTSVLSLSLYEKLFYAFSLSLVSAVQTLDVSR